MSDSLDLIESMKKKLSASQKKFGKAVQLGSEVSICNYISTGSFYIDLALLGGIPEGFATVFSGEPRTGKTTMCLKVVHNFQAKYPDKYVLWVDAENSYDPLYCAKNGVDTSKIILVTQKNGEEVINILDEYLPDSSVGLLIIDSIGMLNPIPMLEREAEASHMALTARLVAMLVRKLNGHMCARKLDGNPLTILCVNQWSTDVGKMFGDNRVMPGGKKQGYFYHVHIDFSGFKEVMGKEDNAHLLTKTEHRFTVKKTRLGTSLMQGNFCINRDFFREDIDEFEIDDVKETVAYSIKEGLAVGAGGSNKVLTLDLSGEVIEGRKWDDIDAALLKDRSLFDELKTSLIMKQRVRNSLPELPPDNYLAGKYWKEVNDKKDKQEKICSPKS